MQTPLYEQSRCQLGRVTYKPFNIRQLKFTTNSGQNSNYGKSVMNVDILAGLLHPQSMINTLFSRMIHRLYNFCKARRPKCDKKLENMVIISQIRAYVFRSDPPTFWQNPADRLLRNTKAHDIPAVPLTAEPC